MMQVVPRDFFCAPPLSSFCHPEVPKAVLSSSSHPSLSFPPGAQISGGASASSPALLSISVCLSPRARRPPASLSPLQQPQHLQSSRSTALSHISLHTRSPRAHARSRTQTQPPAVSHTAQRLFQRHTNQVTRGALHLFMPAYSDRAGHSAEMLYFASNFQITEII
ncbi:hypothetical protein FQA47_020054 [Oryzias melastigma]|uniref:Uncharacterized protein n=1 Tax=Oryzias melastigma TaxID=30732 RepID=A0A834KW39_ORYME|nr:hypothetical protein FQA47_020054 [Oryzias melastigma]